MSIAPLRSTRRRAWAIVFSFFLFSVSGCGGSAPSAPSSTAAPPPSQPQSSTIAGTLVDTLTGAPIAGAAITVAGRAPVTTGTDGTWQSSGSVLAGARQAVTIETPGYLKHDTGVQWNGADRRDVALDEIPDRAPFSLLFYRQLVRNAYEQPDSMQILRRWSTPPNFYVYAINPRTNQPMDPAEVAVIVRTIRDSVPQLTGGRLGAGSIETGTTARDPVIDSIYVHFTYESKGNYCGLSYVGTNPGDITINYDRCASICGSLKVTPQAIAHEVGHAMGFWHIPGTGIMTADWTLPCGVMRFTDQERLHASVADSRPFGNLDVDRDPSTFGAATAGVPGPIVRCLR